MPSRARKRIDCPTFRRGYQRLSFFFSGTAITGIDTLSLHDALPISATRPPAPPTTPSRRLSASSCRISRHRLAPSAARTASSRARPALRTSRSEEHTAELQSPLQPVCRLAQEKESIVPLFGEVIRDYLFSLVVRRSPGSTLFPYTTLFRSRQRGRRRRPPLRAEGSRRAAAGSAATGSPPVRRARQAPARGRRCERADRKSTRLNSSHRYNPYAVSRKKKNRLSHFSARLSEIIFFL